MSISQEKAHDILTSYLGSDFRNAFSGLSRWFTPGQERTIELDVLLSALYLGGAKEIAEYFEEPDSFKKMVCDIFPRMAPKLGMATPITTIQPETTAPDAPTVPGSGKIMPWSPVIFHILWTATRIGKVTGQKRLSIEVFICALATADEHLGELERTRHVRLRGYLPRITT